MARFPFHYYRAVRDEYLRANRAPAAVVDKDDSVIEVDANSLIGEGR